MNQRQGHQLTQLTALLRPPFPPIITAQDIVPNNAPMHARFRARVHIKGETVYRRACVQQAEIQGLTLPPNEINAISSLLWGKEELHIKQAYCVIARQATNNHLRNHVQICMNICLL
jgi:hypothetical protein